MVSLIINVSVIFGQEKIAKGTNSLPGAHPALRTLSGQTEDLYGINSSFIENVGQYGNTYKGHAGMGKILYGYEGIGMPVLFTSKGFVNLQRKTEALPGDRDSRNKSSKEEAEMGKATDRAITMQWVDANENVEIIGVDVATAYHTYGLLKAKARAYNKIIYRELYPGIDVEYSFLDKKGRGFEYKIIAQPGADLSKIKMRYGGDMKSISKNERGELILLSDIDGIQETCPVSYYSDDNNPQNEKFHIVTSVKGKEVSFVLPAGYDKNKKIVIDPFVSGTSNFTGANHDIACDIDFDYSGNVYVSGGGNDKIYMLAKYDASGVLQWTFNGIITTPTWTFGTVYGGWVVEKSTGNVYLTQGFQILGYQVMRLTTAGVFDNYISTPDPAFVEGWKMKWSCNNGNPQIFVAGGSITSNLNLGIVSPPLTTVTSTNITGLAGEYQDIADIVIDPVTNDMYTIFASSFVPYVNNRIYKHKSPYSATDKVWDVPSGYNVLLESVNRPYLSTINFGFGGGNSINGLAVNGYYLFYWDGLTLKAFDKATGSDVGAVTTLSSNTVKRQGGIIADECNNVFIGSSQGTIKVYHFNGSAFDDGSVPDITIPGLPATSVYSLAYDNSRRLLYACGNGFVASFDVSSYCTQTIYSLSIVPSCGLTAQATLTPAPPAGSVVTYSLYDGATLIATNTTGYFTGVSTGITYTVKSYVNQACGGVESAATFLINNLGLIVRAASTNSTCSNSNGTITAGGDCGDAPYEYSINGGVTFQSSGTFTGLAAGPYVITVRDATGTISTTPVTVINEASPTATATATPTTCSVNSGTITVIPSGGKMPYQYSLDGILFQANNLFTGLAGNTYTITVKDANGCTAMVSATVTVPPLAAVVAPTNANCNIANGKITVTGSCGVLPYQYSIDGVTFQSSNVFSALAVGPYTFTIKDAAGSIVTGPITISNEPPPVVTVTSTLTSCTGNTGTITVTAVGKSPFQYSLDGITFQSGNLFTGLAQGSYTITVKDANGCPGTSIIAVNYPPLSIATVFTNANCNNANGTITATGGCGNPPYQYSVDGTSFQVSGLFTGLAPGFYTVTVKDATGIIKTSDLTIINEAPPVVSAVSTPASCVNNDGIITISATGKAPLQYSTDGITYQFSNMLSGLPVNNYIIRVKDGNGCITTFPISVAYINPLTVSASDVTICEGRSATIQATSNGFTFLWTPSSGLSNATLLNPVASPVVTTPYHLVVTSGVCATSTDITVFVNPAPIPNAGPDVAICFPLSGTLSGSGGVSYEWSPSLYLSNPYSQNPSIIDPAIGTYIYSLKISDNKGCESLNSDPVTVSVSMGRLFAGDDFYLPYQTTAQLNAIDVDNTGFTQYTWAGSYGLSDPNIKNPQVWLNHDMSYTVTAHRADGCMGIDDINIKVYNDADLFVPNAFTPNGDITNDILYVRSSSAISIVFKIFNQWGQQIFESESLTRGWDGRFKGRDQPVGVYVYVLKAEMRSGKTIEKKGSVTLVR
jgi:gliding motility-associated-like protein